MPRERKQVGLRLPDDLHDQVTEAARAADISVNRWITNAVSMAIDVRAARTLDIRDRARRIADAHTDRYPPVTPSPEQTEANRFAERLADAAMGRPVGSFDPDTDTPA